MVLQLLCMVAIAFGTATPADIVDPRSGGAWVADTAEVFTENNATEINTLLAALRRDTGVEAMVVTVNNVQTTPKEFATTLFNRWELGSAAKNDGLLMLLVMEQRRVEMETGYGLEAPLPDGWLGTMQSREMVPLFRTGDYGGGVLAGLRAVDVRLQSGAKAAPGKGTVGGEKSAGKADPPRGFFGQFVLVVVSIFFYGLMAFAFVIAPLNFAGHMGFRLWLSIRNRLRVCPECGSREKAMDPGEIPSSILPAEWDMEAPFGVLDSALATSEANRPPIQAAAEGESNNQNLSGPPPREVITPAGEVLRMGVAVSPAPPPSLGQALWGLVKNCWVVGLGGLFPSLLIAFFASQSYEFLTPPYDYELGPAALGVVSGIWIWTLILVGLRLAWISWMPVFKKHIEQVRLALGLEPSKPETTHWGWKTDTWKMAKRDGYYRWGAVQTCGACSHGYTSTYRLHRFLFPLIGDVHFWGGGRSGGRSGGGGSSSGGGGSSSGGGSSGGGGAGSSW